MFFIHYAVLKFFFFCLTNSQCTFRAMHIVSSCCYIILFFEITKRSLSEVGVERPQKWTAI